MPTKKIEEVVEEPGGSTAEEVEANIAAGNLIIAEANLALAKLGLSPVGYQTQKFNDFDTRRGSNTEEQVRRARERGEKALAKGGKK